MKLIMAQIKTVHSLAVGAYVKPRLKSDILRITANLGDQVLVDYVEDPSRIEQRMALGEVMAIQLTEEWLFRFGFVADVPGYQSQTYSREQPVPNWFPRGHCRRVRRFRDEFYVDQTQPARAVQYVHEFQILWYALEGEWLQIGP